MTTPLEQIKERLEKMKKTGLHEFEVGFSRCKHCGIEKVVVDRQSLLITEDNESGGSVREVTTTEYNMEGGPCPKNYGNERNRAISDIQAILPSIIQEVVDACIAVVENKGGHGDKHMEKLKRKLFKDPDFKREYDSLTAHEELLRKDIVTDLTSLKEESK